MEVKLSPSWHFWIANFGKNRISVNGTDICSYTRAFIAGVFWFCVTFGIIGLFSFGTLNAVYECYLYFNEGTKVSLGTEIITMLWAAICGLLFILATTFGVVEVAIPAAINAYSKFPRSEQPTFIGSVYRKFKDKTCFRIVFK
jgi:hypothetical protein